MIPGFSKPIYSSPEPDYSELETVFSEPEPVYTEPEPVYSAPELAPSVYSIAEPRMSGGYSNFTNKSVTLGKTLGDDWNKNSFFLGGKGEGAFYGGSSSFNPAPSPIPVTSRPIGSLGDGLTTFSPESVGFGSGGFWGNGRSDPLGGFDW